MIANYLRARRVRAIKRRHQKIIADAAPKHVYAFEEVPPPKGQVIAARRIRMVKVRLS